MENPLLLTTFVLVFVAFLFGPLFCGWLCAAGGVPEFLGRIIPNRFKLDLRNSTEPSAIRYGFLVGFVASSFYGLHISCAYCQYATLQDITTAFMAGNFGGINHLTFSAGLITFLTWFVIFGLFTKGGRGWCNYVCPVGASQSIFHWVGAKFGFTYKMRFIPEKCIECGTCAERCPMWAIKMNPGPNRNYHACIGCRECKAACPNRAISYARGVDSEMTLLVPGVVQATGKD
ncbi:MAG: 4Fe-4S binding protein [Actinobacteria bacterium]|nr:4Fe-4S binding protein [Actinomycetota bacterium]